MEDRPGGCKSTEDYAHYVHRKIMECMNEYKSKEETVTHLFDQFQITHQMTNIVWDHLEQVYPEELRSYYKICNNNRKIREPHAQKTTTPAQTIEETRSCLTRPRHFLIPRLFRDKRGIEQEQNRRFMENAQNIPRDAGGALIPGGAISVEEFSYYVHGRIMECMRNYKSKEETVKHLLDQFQIAPESTNTVWDRLEQAYPGNFRSYYEACEDNRKIGKHEAPTSTPVENSAAASKRLILRWSKDKKAKEQEQRRTCPSGQRLMETGPSSQVPRLGPRDSELRRSK